MPALIRVVIGPANQAVAGISLKVTVLPSTVTVMPLVSESAGGVFSGTGFIVLSSDVSTTFVACSAAGCDEGGEFRSPPELRRLPPPLSLSPDEAPVVVKFQAVELVSPA